MRLGRRAKNTEFCQRKISILRNVIRILLNILSLRRLGIYFYL